MWEVGRVLFLLLILFLQTVELIPKKVIANLGLRIELCPRQKRRPEAGCQARLEGGDTRACKHIRACIVHVRDHRSQDQREQQRAKMTMNTDSSPQNGEIKIILSKSLATISKHHAISAYSGSLHLLVFSMHIRIRL